MTSYPPPDSYLVKLVAFAYAFEALSVFMFFVLLYVSATIISLSCFIFFLTLTTYFHLAFSFQNSNAEQYAALKKLIEEKMQ